MERDTKFLEERIAAEKKILDAIPRDFDVDEWNKKSESAKRCFDNDQNEFFENLKRVAKLNIAALEREIDSTRAQNAEVSGLLYELDENLDIIKRECAAIHGFDFKSGNQAFARCPYYVEGKDLVARIISGKVKARNLVYEELHEAITASETIIHDLEDKGFLQFENINWS